MTALLVDGPATSCFGRRKAEHTTGLGMNVRLVRGAVATSAALAWIAPSVDAAGWMDVAVTTVRYAAVRISFDMEKANEGERYWSCARMTACRNGSLQTNDVIFMVQ